MKLLQSINSTGLTKYAVSKQKWAALYFDAGAATPAFVAAPTSPYIAFAEDAVIKGLYEAVIETSWPDGRYIIAVYTQAGASPSPVADGEPDVVEVDVKTNFMYIVK